MTYAFTFDASSCTGCKACQVACKDKNHLPTGILWRRVYEVSGGTWQKQGEAWTTDVFAYNLSMACNHCVHPACVDACPADAYTIRPDGIVLLDTSRCMGCGYCTWVCPYDAPQYDAGQGIMTKCNFCYDSLEAGLPPSCVAACPLRVLDLGTAGETETAQGVRELWRLPALAHPFPLPGYSRTEPRLAVRPHGQMENTLEKTVSNREEVQPPLAGEIHARDDFKEMPLVAFTLFIQTAAGLAICALALPVPALPMLLAVGVLLGAGGLTSFLHLGRKRNAWRAVTNIRSSWLSREILLTGLFSASWALTLGLALFQRTSAAPWLMAALGIVLVYCMARVYCIQAVPVWNNWRTPLAFFLSAAVLGSLLTNFWSPDRLWVITAGVALSAELVLFLTEQPTARELAGGLRLALLGLGLTGAVFQAFASWGIGAWLILPVFLVALAAEAIGRWQFYTRRAPSHL